MAKIADKIQNENGGIDFNFTNGTVVTVNPADFPENIQNQLMLYGIKQKLGDAYAGCQGDVEKAIESLNANVEKLLKGDWVAKRASGGGSRSVNQLVAALAQYAHEQSGKELDVDAAQEAYDNMSKEKRADIRKHPVIAGIIAKMKAAKLAEDAEKAGDLSELF